MSKKKDYDFGGWATKCNIRCSDGRTIIPNAFKDQDGQTVPLVWSHNHTELDQVLGHALLENREDGVYAYCSLNDTPKGRNAKEIIKHGDVVSLSIYANKLKQNGNNVVHGVIREVSLVLAGANPGAYIDTIIAHSETTDEEALIYCDKQDQSTIILHSDQEGEESNMADPTNKNPDPKQDPNKDPNNDPNKENNNDIAHGEKDKTVKEVFDSFNDEQKTVTYALVGEAVEKTKEEIAHKLNMSVEDLDKKLNSKENSEEKNMKHNAFNDVNKENDPNKDITNSGDQSKTLSHSEFQEILGDAKRNGSMKDAFIQHGINDVENLFPEVQNLTPMPKVVDMKHDWVEAVLGNVKHSPFARVKSTFVQLTEYEARAKGYIKGNQKIEEFFNAVKRTTDPTTVYKLQKMDRDDVIDITDFDVIAFIKEEMRVKLKEELARAILTGDDRDAGHMDKISEEHIRPIATDSDIYTIKAPEYPATTSLEEDAEKLIDDVVIQMDNYKGNGGNTVGFIKRSILTRMLLLKDTVGHRLYRNADEIAMAMTLDKLVPIPDVVYNPKSLYLIVVDLKDYNIGKNKKGDIAFFDDFDLNFNKMEYLIETRCSGALVTPYSAIVFKKTPTNK